MIRQEQRHSPSEPACERAVPLADDALDSVVAGLDCSTAQAVSRAYTAAGYVMQALGDERWASYYNGRASGVLEAGCPK